MWHLVTKPFWNITISTSLSTNSFTPHTHKNAVSAYTGTADSTTITYLKGDASSVTKTSVLTTKTTSVSIGTANAYLKTGKADIIVSADKNKINQVIYVSATPGDYELSRSAEVIEQIIRPTGLLDPTIEVRKTEGQIDDLVGEINTRIEKNENDDILSKLFE